MTFFESLLLLLLIAIVLLQLSRHLALPYPAMLAAAGVVVAFIPGTPPLHIEPATALALFIAPAIVDSAFDFPPGAAIRFWGPLVAFAGFAVLVTAGLVAVIGHQLAHLPWPAAIALGAIVAPPDAAAASAVLGAVTIPRSTEEILKGESLFNDATALLLFSGALAVQAHGSLSLGVGVHLGLAIPGGIVLGMLWARVLLYLNRFVRDTLGGNLLQFVNAYIVWLTAEHLQLSAVLCTISFAMTLARAPELRGFPRMRVQSYAVWSAVVFALNVFAFLIMGMQARSIVHAMQTVPLEQALRFAGVVVLAVIVARMLVVVGFERGTFLLARARDKTATSRWRHGLFTGWSGMRGFVTLATAFALPPGFPQRDTIVLTAFAVVLATLVVQGLTLKPWIRILGLDQDDTSTRELAAARSGLAAVALRTLAAEGGAIAAGLRFNYQVEQDAADQRAETEALARRRELGLRAIRAERDELEAMRGNNQVGIALFGLLQEEIDWRELTLLRDEERRIEES